MDAQRSDILNQLAEGRLSAEQAADQLRGEPAATAAGVPGRERLTPAQTAATAGRWLRLRVTDLPSGQPKVTLNVPLNWVALGLQIGARFSPAVAGLNLGELLETLPTGATAPLIDVEDIDDGERVQIYID